MSGKAATGGTVRNAKMPFMSSGALVMNSRYQRIKSAAWLIGQSVGPATTVLTGCSRNRKEKNHGGKPPDNWSRSKAEQWQGTL
jgi:hypothetical protein